MIPILTTASTILCPHGGELQLSTSNTMAIILGAPAMLVTDVHSISKCPFTLPGGTPQPCVIARWMTGATWAKVRGIPLLLQNSVGTCFSAEQIPSGPPVVVAVQQRAKAL
jgi:hypothetical protein